MKSDGITPNKAQRRPDAAKPSLPKKNKMAVKPKKMAYRPQGR